VLRSLKADVVLGAQLVSRHRSPRLAAILALVLLGAAGTQTSVAGLARAPLALSAAGMLAAVAGSRLFAPGGALAAHRAVAATWWITPVGRLAGGLLLVHALSLAGAGLVVLPGAAVSSAVRVSFALILYGTAVAAATAALTPTLGSSPAAVLGLVSAWLGVIPPSGLAGLLSSWPVLARPLVWLWNVLPLPWRAARWISRGDPADPALLAAWVAVGVAALAWSASRFYRSGGRGGPA
jgi:hypothetical protein